MRVDRVLVQGDAGAAAPGTLNAYDAITQQLIGSTVVPANGAYTLQIQWQQLLSAIAAGLSGASAVPSQIPTLSLSAAVQAASSVGGAISGTLLIQAIAAGIGAGAGTPQYQVALQAVAQARSNGVGVSQAIAQGSLSGGVAGIGSGVDATLAVIMAMGGVSAGVGGAGGVVTYQQFLQGLGAGLVAAVDSSLVITGGATNAITTPASDGLSFNSPVTIAGTAAPGASIQLWDHGTHS